MVAQSSRNKISTGVNNVSPDTLLPNYRGCPGQGVKANVSSHGASQEHGPPTLTCYPVSIPSVGLRPNTQRPGLNVRNHGSSAGRSTQQAAWTLLEHQCHARDGGTVHVEGAST